MRIKFIVILLSSITLLFGCNSGGRSVDYGPINAFGFTKSELVVDVTPETKSFRIEITGLQQGGRFPEVELDTLNTSAKHNFHFINAVGSNGSTIGLFTLIPNSKKSYKDVEIIPENITKNLVINYTMPHDDSDTTMLIKSLTVRLKPLITE